MAGPFIFVFTGTSGSGRKTIAHRIGEELGIEHVLSYTTRPPRDTEPPDRDYHYITRERFEAMERCGEFVETAVIGRERYGLRTQELFKPIQEGRHAYVILNSEGASILKRLYGEQVVRLFLYVDKRTVKERLETKGMPVDVIDRYLGLYTEEVVYRKQCEHVIENMTMNRSLEQIRTAIQSHL
ncbi:guanylate kinase [Paenibacillus phyllosphaerae]|uniref:Guanylate kinase n=1 Tax=Paenibacillus phyllosphaerae TaxID=274593 RepID=A0A7W5B1C0_9BACL|nr:guanylate kinase [Paenibacillus phyllosphaerae]MBB3112625.1 guanylate kinase [Paenibacillus phyllosphaerae]